MTFTPEQLVERRKFLGASECSSALGMSPFFSQVELYLDKIGAGTPIEETIPMMVGQALEPVTLALLEKEQHFNIELRQQVFQDEDTPWRRCTIDGWVENEKAVIEAKTSGDFRGWGDGEDDIPEHYLYNAQHSMACIKDAKVVIFPVLIGGRTFRTYRVERNEKLIELIKAGEDGFMEMVRKRRQPLPQTREDVQKLYPKDNGLFVVADELIQVKFKDFLAVRENLKQAEVLKDALLRDITSYMGHAGTLKRMVLGGPAGEPLATWNSQERRDIDADALRARYPEIAREVTRVSSNRVFRVKESKKK